MKKVFILLSFILLFKLSNAQVNLSAGLVAYWDFNGNANDVSGNNNNGILNGTTLTTGQAGIPNTAYSFNGTSNYIQVPNSASLNFPGNAYSIYALVKPMGFYAGPCHGNSIVDKGNADYIPGWYCLRFGDGFATGIACSSPVNPAVENFFVQQYNMFSGANYTPYIDTGTWYCVIAIYDGSTVKCYKDGVLVGNQVAAGLLGVNTHDLFIGRKNDATYPYWFNGVMDEIRIYDRALNFQEVHALCGCPAPATVVNTLLNNDTTICAASPVQLLTNPLIDTNSIFSWYPTSTLNDSTSLNPMASPATTTTYYFNLMDKGCNVIDNGDFESGNTGFTSQYNYAAINTTEGEYTIGTNPQSWNGALGSFGDHTTGTGNMLLVNGAPVPNTSIWCKTVPVTPNTNYSFSAWIQNVNVSGSASNPPTLQFSINGILLGTPFTASTTAGLWQQFYQIWNSGTDTTATICIVNQNIIASGNDFAIDDISFSPFTTQTDSVTITIQNPLTIIAGPDTSVCSGIAVQLYASGANTYLWNPVFTLTNPNISNPISTTTSSTTYTVTGTDNTGCSNTATVSIIIKPSPNVSAVGSPSSVCPGNPTTLSGGGAISYLWSGGVTNGISFVPNATTNYTVTGTDANGCTNTSSVTVNVVNNLTISVSPSNPILCLGDSIQLTASGASTYSWSPNISISASNIPDPWVFPGSTTTYFVIGTDASGCSGSASVIVEIVTDPKLTLSKSGDIECNIHTIQLSASGASTYSWTPATFLSSPNSSVTNATITQATTFVVTGSVGSCVVIDSISVSVFNNDETSIFIPNAFSPNDDGNNDCLHIVNTAKFTDYYFAVYNRWGQQVFESDNPNECWNGDFKNKRAAVATYYYFLRGETRCGKIFKKGDVTLLR